MGTQTQLDREELPTALGRGASERVPAILLAKLAMSRRHQGEGLGRDLLLEALATIIAAARRAGGRLVVVDAISEFAASFYRHHGFVPIPDNERRLVMKLSSAAKVLGVPWP
ncbi:MAG TPA: GNAT family N-acetyltransferase [Acidimicrobiales bacterium]|nr:GNAT family N-acetyltransferase [Acidimicrobiales bacterium]